MESPIRWKELAKHTPAPRYHGIPTDRGQAKAMERYYPDLLKRLREDSVDAVLPVPNCPVCHQSVSLAARYLQANGMSAVVMGAPRTLSSVAACRVSCSVTFPRQRRRTVQ